MNEGVTMTTTATWWYSGSRSDDYLRLLRYDGCRERAKERDERKKNEQNIVSRSVCFQADHASVGGVMVSIVAFQAVDPGSIPGRRRMLFCGRKCRPNWTLRQSEMLTFIEDWFSFRGCVFKDIPHPYIKIIMLYIKITLIWRLLRDP